MTRQIVYEVLRTFDSSTLDGTYQKFGGPLLNPASIIKLINTSTSLVLVSIDGVNPHDVAPPSFGFVLDETANSPINNNQDSVYMPQGTQFYLNGDAGSGMIYLVVQYNRQT